MKYKITYINNGDIRIKNIEAKDEREARYKFYMSTQSDDIKSIEEVKENV